MNPRDDAEVKREKRDALSRYLVERMGALGYADDTLAKAAKVSRTTVFRARNGRTYPNNNTLHKLLVALGGANGVQSFFEYANRQAKLDREHSSNPDQATRSTMALFRDQRSREDELRAGAKFFNFDQSYQSRIKDSDYFPNSYLKNTLEKCDELFKSKVFSVSPHSDNPTRYALRIIPNHIERMNFVSSKIVGQESYKHLGPFLGDMLIDYADVAARAMELESSIAATQLAEEIYLIFLGRLSEDRFEAMIQRARAYSQTYRFDLARDCFERIVEEVESWTDAQVFSLSFLIEDILDPCIEFFQSQQDFDRQLDIYQLKLRKTVTQHSRPELSHLIPDVLPQMIFDIIEHQMEIWDQDDAEEKYDAARTFDDVEKNFGRRVREKLERLLLLNEVEL